MAAPLAAAMLTAGAAQASAATRDAYGPAQVPATPPAVTAVSPTHGPEVGGNTVTITGTSLTGTTAVAFGGKPASSVVVVSDNTVTAIAPPFAHGTVDITVTTPTGISSTSSADHYTYDEPAPAVTAIFPTNGPETGGTTVTVTGVNLASTMAVMVGGTPASNVVVISDNTVTAIAPPHADGTVDVTVISPTGTSGTSSADQYTYGQPLPAVTAVSFGGTLATSFTVSSDASLSVTAPPAAAAGPVDVTVTTPAGTSSAGAASRYSDTCTWPTATADAGTCQALTLGLDDGTVRTASFTFAS